jgi:hypothetical protein
MFWPLDHLQGQRRRYLKEKIYNQLVIQCALPKGYHLNVVGGPSTPHDAESNAGGSLSSWQGHPNR